MQAAFDTTSWSLVLAAAASGTPDSSGALADLCSRYWYPVYAFVRRQGYAREEAEDLTQGFFERLLEKDGLRHADPERGRFRSFLLASAKHFLANERDRVLTKKRGGDRVHVPLDFDAADEWFQRDAKSATDPEKLFTRRWALTVLESALRATREELEREGRGDDLDLLVPFLTGDAARGAYAPLAEKLRVTEGAARVAVHRLRARFRDQLRLVVASTMPDGAPVDEEIRFLIGALSP